MRGKSRESSFIKHWVKVRLDGYRPERILNKAMDEGIVIRNFHQKDETESYFQVSSKGHKEMEKLMPKTYRLSVVKEGGCGPALKRIRMNKLLLIGMALFILFYLVQFSLVKEINVVGCQTIPEDQLREVLREEGLYEGAFRTFDCDKIEGRLFDEYDEIVWTKVAYQGSFVQVEIVEGELQQQEMVDRTQPCHLVAERDCYIETVRTFRGRAKVENGDFVKKGGILISGKVPIEHPTYSVEDDTAKYHYVHAEGEVTARVPYYCSMELKRGLTKEQQQAEIRQWIKKNIPENAEILNKDFHFEQKKNIIEVYGVIETRQPVGIEKEINIDKRETTGNEKNAD